MNDYELYYLLSSCISLLLYAHIPPSSPAFKDVLTAFDALLSARSSLNTYTYGSSH